jgi:hypothetical protein
MNEHENQMRNTMREELLKGGEILNDIAETNENERVQVLVEIDDIEQGLKKLENVEIVKKKRKRSSLDDEL